MDKDFLTLLKHYVRGKSYLRANRGSAADRAFIRDRVSMIDYLTGGVAGRTYSRYSQGLGFFS